MDEQDFNMVDEFGANLRTSTGDILMNTLNNFKYKDLDPEEQFYVLTDAVFNKLIDLELGYINNSQKDYILSKISEIDKPGYKNSPSFIIGLYLYISISEKSKKKQMGMVKQIFDSLPQINSLSDVYPIFKINKQDIIRYSRLWQKLEL